MILTKVKLQSIDYANLPSGALNKFTGDAIMLCCFYVCDSTHNEIMENIFSREELHYDAFILEGEVEISDA